MPSFQINDAEWEALTGLPLLSREVYFVLRRFMDYRSGITGGPARRISYQSLSEELYVEPHQGIKGGSPTINELRRAIQWLERAELVTRDTASNKGQKQLVFQLVLASRDYSVRNKVNSKCTVEVDSHLNTPQPSNCGDSTGDMNSEDGRPKTAKVNIPPESGLPSTPQRAHETSPYRFAMTESWQPTQKGWSATVTRNGLTPDLLTTDALAEFRSYWINRPDKHQSQGQWEHALAQHLKREYRREQRNTNRTKQAGQRTGTARPRSAVDRVKQNIADRRAAEAAAESPGTVVGGDDGDLRPPLDGEFWRPT
ncbi:MAG: hypothetical protein COA41_11250 [Sphingopyxis sp.]|nr:MAG: hypothetical protein COA41_11250 [Sphingopyxis sp.]